MYKFPCPPSASPLRRFIALPSPALLVLGPRRLPPLATPASNTYTGLSVLTSVGFRTLEIDEYIRAAQKLRPDIIIGPADVQAGDAQAKAGAKRKEKMSERTMAWMKGLHLGLRAEDAVGAFSNRTKLFAPIMPIEGELQAEYLDYLSSDSVSSSLGGIALYDAASTLDLPPRLLDLPRLALTNPNNPQALLREIALGVDVATIPFLTAATDAGVALTFSFPAPDQHVSSANALSLGINLHPATHAMSLLPLTPDCDCYTCTTHHRAYINHLLSAKEMLAWVLLQVHNHAVIHRFYVGVRTSIASGTFEKDAEDFNRAYESDLELGTGLGPRIRGYQVRSEGVVKEKINKPPYQKLEEDVVANRGTERERALDEGMQKIAEATGLPGPDVDGAEMDDLGFAMLIGDEDEEGEMDTPA